MERAAPAAHLLTAALPPSPSIFGGGRPIIRDQRFAVEHLLGYVDAGMSEEELLEQLRHRGREVVSRATGLTRHSGSAEGRSGIQNLSHAFRKTLRVAATGRGGLRIFSRRCEAAHCLAQSHRASTANFSVPDLIRGHKDGARLRETKCSSFSIESRVEME